MARYRDDGEVQIDNSTKVHFRNAFQQLIMIAALNVGTLLFLNIFFVHHNSTAAAEQRSDFRNPCEQDQT
jgi:hypothetical protein